MPAYAMRSVLNLFLASPSDLTDERQVAREIVDEINRYVRGLNWHVELLGWEDTLPGFSRPQELINRDVDSCDLFIGMLWRRWGQPTGQYDSGFEEEFERARQRRSQAGGPEIWLCFKQVDPDLLKDPGDQLRKVIAFRRSLEQSKELLFKEFQDADKWKELLREWLLKYVIELHQQMISSQSTSALTSSTPVQQPQEMSQPEPVQARSASKADSVQILKTLESTSSAMRAGEFTSTPLKEGKVSGDLLSAARAYLFGLSWLSAINTGELLGTHGINLLYLQREHLEIIGSEKLLLARTVISDNSETSPGWFWFKDWQPQLAEDILHDRALSDSNWLVRQQALELLYLVGANFGNIRISDKTDFIKAILTDRSDAVLESALKYFGKTLNLDDLPILRSAISANSLIPRDKALQAEQLILVRNGQPLDVAALIPALKPTTEIISELEKRVDDLDDETLRATIQHSDRSLGVLALKTLGKRGRLSVEQLKDLLTDSSPTVKAQVYEQLIKYRATVTSDEIRKSVSTRTLLTFSDGTDPELLIFELFKSYTYEQLLSIINWFSIDSPIAYKVLAIHHFDTFGTTLRDDLQVDFENIRAKSIDEFGAVADLVLKRWEKNTDDFVRRQYTAAALSGLAVNGESPDADYARKYLNETSRDVQTEAVNVLYRFGERDDAPALVALALSSWGELQSLAAEAALKLAPGHDGAVQELLLSDTPTLVSLSIHAILKYDNQEEFPDLVASLLQTENATNRLNAVFYFLKRFEDRQLEAMLKTYLKNDSYYYNVVCWLDRVLYSPLRDAFRRELERRFSA
jgi:hypothetical protein